MIAGKHTAHTHAVVHAKKILPGANATASAMTGSARIAKVMSQALITSPGVFPSFAPAARNQKIQEAEWRDAGCGKEIAWNSSFAGSVVVRTYH